MADTKANTDSVGFSANPAMAKAQAEANDVLNQFISENSKIDDTNVDPNEPVVTTSDSNTSTENKDIPTETDISVEPEGESEVKDDVVVDEKAKDLKETEAEKAGLERLASREKTLRESEAAFEDKVSAAVKAKIPDFTGKDPEDILKHYGVDPEIAFKMLLLQRVSKDNPNRAKIEADLRDYKSDQKIAKLERDIKEKEEATERGNAQRAYREKFTADTREKVLKIDKKVAPTIAEFIEAKEHDYIMTKVMREIIEDASQSHASGRAKDVMTPEEAIKIVEADFVKMAKVMRGKKTAEASKSITTPRINKPITEPVKLSNAQETQKALDDAVKIGMDEYSRLSGLRK